MKRQTLSTLALFLVAACASPAMAATFTVTPTSDNDCSDFNCDLQSALNAAANNGAGDTLNIQSGTYNVSANGGNPFSYLPAVTENFPLSLIGASTTPPVLDGNSLNLVLSIDTTAVAAPDDANADILIQNLVVQNGNSPGAGGGMAAFSDAADISVDGCSFLNSRNLSLYSGGMDIETDSGNASLTNSIVQGNISVNGIGGAGVFADTGDIVVTGNTFINNTAGDSVGGVDAASGDGNLLFSDNLVSGNTAVNLDGGAEIASDGPVTITNNIIIGNTATNGNVGGAEIFGETTVNVVNNTISGNTSGGNGGGVFLDLFASAVANVYNNIVWGNSAAGTAGDILVDNATGTANFFNNDFSSLGCDVGGCGTLVNSPTNIDQDPLFVDLAGGNVNLSAGSPCIDAATASAPGIPSVDFAGNPRIIGPAPDMGALESLPQLSVNPASLNFGAVGVSQESSLVLTLSNNGANVLNVTGMTLSDNVNYSLDVNGGSDPCGSTTPVLNSGESCTVLVVFDPTVVGDLPGNLTITSDDPNNLSLIVPLIGTGTAFGLSGAGACSMNPGASSGWQFYFLLIPMLAAVSKRALKR